MSSIKAAPPADPTIRIKRPRPVSAWRQSRRNVAWAVAAALILLVGWVAATAPLARSLSPPVAPSLTLLSADGEPIARQGAEILAPVRVDRLPPHVWQAFLAVEDRRFLVHNGIDPRGLARAAWRNLAAGEIREGGSTITQQLAKTVFLSSERTVGRKLREFIIAMWMELWLGKGEILSRYLSSVYFGNNVYGLRAAANHYFDCEPEQLSIEQAALLAGIVKAPSRLNPVADPDAARDRTRIALAAMADVGLIDASAADRRPVPHTVRRHGRPIPSGTYFADWVFPQARAVAERQPGSAMIRTTLDADLQRLAVDAVRRADLGDAQVALVAMRPDGRVVAMVGGRSYRRSPFNRAVSASRPSGSTFKLFVYLAALRAGYTPQSLVDDSPIAIGGWSPANADGRYRGRISLREAARTSSNVAAVRLAEQLGRDRVIRAARDLGVTAPLDDGAAVSLGTSGTTLLEMTAAYAAVAAGRYPIHPYGLPRSAGAGEARQQQTLLDRRTTWPMLLDLLWTSANAGTGRAAALPVPTFGKTGTSQDNRDALFIGFAENLTVGVWVGNDDNRSLGDVAGGDLPARIWRRFMSRALQADRRDAAGGVERPARIGDDRPQDRTGDYRGRGEAAQREWQRERWRRFFERPRKREWWERGRREPERRRGRA